MYTESESYIWIRFSLEQLDRFASIRLIASSRRLVDRFIVARVDKEIASAITDFHSLNSPVASNQFSLIVVICQAPVRFKVLLDKQVSLPLSPTLSAPKTTWRITCCPCDPINMLRFFVGFLFMALFRHRNSKICFLLWASSALDKRYTFQWLLLSNYEQYICMCVCDMCVCASTLSKELVVKWGVVERCQRRGDTDAIVEKSRVRK